MADPFVCVRQRAGPFVKAFSTDRACFVRRSKDSKGLIRKRAGPAMCRTSVDKLELRLALFGYDGVFYTLTFAPEHLPVSLDIVQAVWVALLRRPGRWNRPKGQPELLRLPHRGPPWRSPLPHPRFPAGQRLPTDGGAVPMGLGRSGRRAVGPQAGSGGEGLLESGPIFHQGGHRGWAASVGMLPETQPHDTASGGLVQPHRGDPPAFRSRAAAYPGPAQSWGVGRVLLHPLSGPGKIALLF